MAEVINGQRGTVTGAAQAAPVNSLVGSEGRVSVNAHNLSGVGNLINDYVAGNQRTAAAVRQAQKDRDELAGRTEAAQFALAETDLNFQAALTQLDPESAAAVVDYRQKFNADDSADAGLRNMATRQRLLEEAQRQGGNQVQVMASLLSNVNRQRFLRNNPGYATEALSVSGFLSENQRQQGEVFKDAEFEYQRRQDNIKAQDTLLRGANLDPLQLTPQQRDVALREVRSRNQAIVDMDADIKAVQASNATFQQKSQETDSRLNANGEVLGQEVASRLRIAMSNPQLTTPQARFEAGRQLLRQERARVQAAYGVDPQRFDATSLGLFMKDLDKMVEDAVTGRINNEELENRVQFMYNSTKAKLYEATGGDIATMQVIQNAFGPNLSSYAKAQGFDSAVTNVLKSAADMMKGRAGQAFNGIDPSSTQAQVDDTVQKTLTIVSDQYDNAKDEVTKAGLTNSVHSALSDARVLRNYANVDKALQVAADPRFVQLTEGTTTPQTVLDTTNEALKKIRTASRGVFTTEGDNIVVTFEDNGTVHFDLKAPSTNAAKVKMLEQQVNTWVKASAHLNHSTNYPSIVRRLIAEGM